MNNRTHAEIIILIVTLLGAIITIPFSAYRFIIGDYMLATIEAFVCAFTFGLFGYVWVTQKYKLAGAIICTIYLATTVCIVYMKGPSTIYWAYTTTLACFCIISSRLAIVLCGITIASLFVILYDTLPVEHLLEIFTTLVLLCVFSYIFNSSVRHQRNQLSTLAACDALTGVWNRRALDETLLQTTNNNNLKPVTASIIMLDLDHFKKLNDTYGHDVGDKILVNITQTIQESIRLSDRLFRYGGEEFVVIADGANLQSAAVLAESIRKKVESSNFFKKERVTISLGVATLEAGQNPETWVKLADKALYEAKRSGRNKFCLAEEQQYFKKDGLLTV